VGQGLIPENEQDSITGYLIHNEVDVKREDALLVIEKIIGTHVTNYGACPSFYQI